MNVSTKSCNLGVEKGTIHTKRHSGEDPSKASHVLGDFAMDKCKNQEDMYADEVSFSVESQCVYVIVLNSRIRIKINVICLYLNHIHYLCLNMGATLPHCQIIYQIVPSLSLVSTGDYFLF